MNAQPQIRRRERTSHPEGWCEWLHEVLLAWGRWATSMDDGGRGWPREVPWARLHVTRNTFESKLPSEIVGQDILRADAAISRLGPHPRMVVVTFYKLGGARNLTAERLHCSTRLVTETVVAAHVVLRSDLTGT